VGEAQKYLKYFNKFSSKLEPSSTLTKIYSVVTASRRPVPKLCDWRIKLSQGAIYNKPISMWNKQQQLFLCLFSGVVGGRVNYSRHLRVIHRRVNSHLNNNKWHSWQRTQTAAGRLLKWYNNGEILCRTKYIYLFIIQTRRRAAQCIRNDLIRWLWKKYSVRTYIPIAFLAMRSWTFIALTH
jgi:hypothetical protein